MAATITRQQITAGPFAMLAGAVAVLALGYWALVGPTVRPAAPPLDMVAVQMDGGQTLFVQRHELTAAEWNRCHAAGACHLELIAGADGSLPATGLSYLDALDYLAWINAQGRGDYRLPTHDEWLALAEEVLPEAPDPIFTDPAMAWAADYLMSDRSASRALQPSGSFAVTGDGIADLDGNVWEWTQDCYPGAGGTTPTDHCPAYLMGGEHKAVMSYLVRDPARGGCAVGSPPAHLGMRLVADRQPG